ncbi:MAG: transcription-repair coupling factor [Candidatus Kerfeldbacteria bacterium]|nr:transcription-repair coupling factor [Candidatus Kerfeldbacteria bacterium]
MRYHHRRAEYTIVPLSRHTVVAEPFRHAPAGAWFRHLTEQLNTPSHDFENGAKTARLVGVPNATAEAFAMAKILGALPPAWQIVYLVGSEREQQTAVAGLSTWRPDAGPVRPVMGIPPITGWLLDQLLLHTPAVLVAQQSAFAESLPNPTELHQQFTTINTGAPQGQSRIIKQLTASGYEGVQSVDRMGQWAKRGEVVDVWPVGAPQAFRISFSGLTIASIAPFSDHQMPMPPSLACPPSTLRDLDPRISLLAYLQPMRTLIVVPRASLLDSLPRGKDAVKQYRQLIIEPFGSEGATKLDWRAAAFYHSQWPLIAKDIKKYSQEQYRVVIQSHRRDELIGLLKRHEAPVKKISWLDHPDLRQGFIAPSEKYLYLTDEELFGRDQRAKSNRRRVEDVFLGDLNEGDYVVHLDHGIGKFSGMKLQRMNGHTKEFFVLEYAGGDKLYVPVETADKITRYIGSPHPKIHSLSSSSWAAVTRRIQQDASIVAKELLELYAQRELAHAPALLPQPQAEERLAEEFPYDLTSDQERTLQETLTDLEKDVPMDRLVCGDVGFGKTEVAVRAAFRAVMNGKQVALLSPTTILTQQHFDTFKKRLAAFPVKIGALSRFESLIEQDHVLAGLAAGQIDIVIGTHRLLSADVKFKSLGLIIVDEEQRFGVRHKEKLKALRTEAHVLTLTATPIPRTLNFALSGLRDISVIETPPEGRRPIETNITTYDDDIVKDAVERELARKGQVYYVHNDVETIELERDRLQELLPGVTFGIAHGQMDERRLLDVMSKFDNEKLDVLLASTIIENGLDLPNVNTLIVDNATKFGLAQLYQLRGRIGRGDRQAYAYFLYRSEKVAGKPQKRLQALLEAKELGSGFRLAMRDLEIRGTGSILGQKQHGHVTAVGLNLYARLLAQAVEELRTGKPARATREILIDLPMAIAIPKDFLPSEPKRLRLYQRLAGLETIEDLHEFRRHEFKNASLPEPLTNLLEALELKILAQRTAMTAIQQSKYSVDGLNKEKIIIKFGRMITPEQIGKLLERNQAWDFTPEFIKIDRDQLGTRWLHELKHVIKIFEEPSSPPQAAPAAKKDIAPPKDS